MKNPASQIASFIAASTASHGEDALDLSDGQVFPSLHAFQQEGIAFAIQQNGRCLFGDEMGLGKTVQALGTAFHYRNEVGVWPVLIVCPSSLRFVWKDEVEKWMEEGMIAVGIRWG